MKRIRAAATLIVFLIVACETTPPTDFESAALLGMIYSLTSRPVPNMKIVLDDERTIRSDIEGRFIFTDVAKGQHTIVASLENYEPIIYSFSFTDRTQVLHLIAVSLTDLVDKFEQAISKRNWNEGESLAARIEAVNPEYPDYLYLQALSAHVRGDRQTSLAYLQQLNELGISSLWIDRLRDLSEEELAERPQPSVSVDAIITPVDPDAPSTDAATLDSTEEREIVDPDTNGNDGNADAESAESESPVIESSDHLAGESDSTDGNDADEREEPSIEIDPTSPPSDGESGADGDDSASESESDGNAEE